MAQSSTASALSPPAQALAESGAAAAPRVNAAVPSLHVLLEAQAGS